MAEGKESFLLYRDIIHTVRKLSDVDAGQLFKHILSYCHDEHPVTDNIIVEIAFEPIRQSFKRDLKKWEKTIDQKSNAGKISAAKKDFYKFKDKILLRIKNEGVIDLDFERGICLKRRNEEYASNDGQDSISTHYYNFCIEYLNELISTLSTRVDFVEQKPTEPTVSVSVPVSVLVPVIKREKRKTKVFIPPLLNEVEDYFIENGYGTALALKFFNSYSVANWHDSKDNPVKNWKQKAINVWFKDENKVKSNDQTFKSTPNNGKLAGNYQAANELAEEIREKSKRFEERMQNTT